MGTFFLNSIKDNENTHPKLYEKVVNDVFGNYVSLDELQQKNNKELISVLCQLEEAIKIEQSPYDVDKLSKAIQSSRSGIGGSAMTSFKCAFCNQEEVWENTAVPNICTKCSKEMARNVIINGLNIQKS